jgi:hypothetical protein
MRKFVAAALAMLVVLLIAALAQGNSVTSPGGITQSLTDIHSPNKAGKGAKVTTVLSTRCDPTKQCQAPPAPLGKASPVLNTVLHLPKGMKNGYKYFPTCDPAKLASKGVKGCSKKAIVGKGKLTADGRPVVDTPVSGTVTAFNGTTKGGKARYLLYVVPELSSPLVLVGTLSGTTLSIPVPAVPTLPGQPNATLTDFSVTTGGTIKKKKHGKTVKYSYLTNPKKCTKAGYVWKYDFTYENGEKLSPTDAAPCKK